MKQRKMRRCSNAVIRLQMLNVQRHRYRCERDTRRRSHTDLLQVQAGHDKTVLHRRCNIQGPWLLLDRQMKFQRPCLVCGGLSTGTRCATHDMEYRARREAQRDTPERRERKRNLYNSQYRSERNKLVAGVRAYGATCYLCKQPLLPSDPIEADHLEPGNPNSELAPVHRLCNQRRGNKPLT